MLDLNTVLANLTAGRLPLAIGTSFAIESTLGILDRDTFKTENASSVKSLMESNSISLENSTNVWADAKEIWFNIRTVFRNIYNALDSNVKDKLTKELALQVTFNELNNILNVYRTVSFGSKVVFYVCHYKSLLKEYPNAFYKAVKTDNQRKYNELEDHIVKEIVKSSTLVKVFDVKIKGMFPKAAIVTHYPLDLLSHRSFEKLVLLESHTGNIKGKSEWNSKLTNGKEIPNIPFNPLTLQIFGDGVLFSPMIINIRRMIIELSIQRHWNVITSRDKIISDIKTLKDHLVKDMLLLMAKSW